MKNIYCLYMVFSADRVNNNTQVYLLSSSQSVLFPPVVKAQSVKQILNELRYNFKIMFDEKSIKYIEECVFSELAVQNEYAVKLLEESIDDFDPETDLVLTYITTFTNKDLVPKFSWQKIQFNHESNAYHSNKNLNYLIDYAMEKI